MNITAAPTTRILLTALAALAATAVPASTEAANAVTCDTDTSYISARNLTKYVPLHIRGDRDYSGNGPDVRLKATLELLANSSGGTTMRIRTAMTAEETVADWTTAQGVRYSPLFVTLAGHRVVRIVDASGRSLVLQDSKYYRDSDHADDLLGPGYVTSQYFASFVSSYLVTGDTAGDEAGTKTGVTLTTRGMYVYSSTC